MITNNYSLTINGYECKLNKPLKFYQGDSLHLIFTVNQYEWVINNGNRVRAIMPINPLKAFLIIENPEDENTDTIESAFVENDEIHFHIDSKYTSFVGVGRMQLVLADDGCCNVTIPEFTYEIKKNITDKLLNLSKTTLIDTDNKVLMTDSGDDMITGLALSTESNTSKYIKDLPNKETIDGEESVLIQDQEGTKNVNMKVLLDDINSRTNLADIQNQITETNAQLSHINNYPRIDGEDNDFNRIIRALNGIKNGGKLRLSSGIYDLNGNDIVISKEINIVGDSVNTVIFNNGGIRIESNNVIIENIFVNCPNLDNAFQCNNGAYSGIVIKNCKGMAREHSFLFESYYGTVQNILVENCESDNSIHGFISKASTIIFKNCHAKNHTSGFGFGCISDNIIGETNIANALCNTVIDCEAYNCSVGFRAYCRDKFNSICKPRCYNNVVRNLTVNKCMYPLVIGEEETPIDYQSIYQIEFLLIDGVRELNPVQSDYTIRFRKSYRCVVDNCITYNGVLQDSNAVDNLIGNVIAQNKTYANTHALSLNADNGSLNTSLNSCFEVMLNASTTATDKIKLTGTPKNGSIVTILVRNAGKGSYGGFDSANTVIDTAKFSLLTSGITFNHCQLTQWIWVEGIKKWVCYYTSELINLA